MAEQRERGEVAGGASSPESTKAASRPDLEGARFASDDVGSLPVPRAIRQAKGQALDPDEGAPMDVERGLLPGARRPHPPARRAGPGTPSLSAESEAQLRRSVPRAARTPEELGRALGRIGETGVRDPQRGREAGPPLPGEGGMRGEE